MDYYIRGNAARAKEIKAAFEAKGINTASRNCSTDEYLYYTYNGLLYLEKFYDALLNVFKSNPGYKELELPAKPMFKVGDWIVGNEGIFKITQYEDEHGYDLTDTTGCVVHFVSPDYVESNFHLWTIADAKDGDVITNGKLIVIFNKLEEPAYKQRVIAYTGLDLSGRLQITDTEDTWQLGIDKAMPATKEQRDLLFKKIKEAGYEWDAELKKITVKPMFKVGDWLYSNCNGIYPVLVTDYSKYCGYQLQERSDRCHLSRKIVEDNYHLWTIQDAKDGDVLCTYECGNPKIVFILRGNPEENCSVLSYYCYYNIMYPHFEPNAERGCLAPKREDVKPATKEQRDLLFEKMKAAGYTWDAEKKELSKIKPHYGISNFHAGMPVLVRDSYEHKWLYTIFGMYDKPNSVYPFVVVDMRGYEQCIPFDGNEHLLGTTDMCDEQYVNW
jgi:hypothetical protein